MARTMAFSPFALVVLVLSILNVSVAAKVADVDAVQPLAARQSPSANAATLPVCMDYSMVANLSTVALNSTYRAAFLQSISLGRLPARAIIDSQSPKLPALMMDVQLNQQCGNLSQVALDGAALNFTQGTVLGLPILVDPGVAPGNLAMPFVSAFAFLSLGLMWLSL
ncbi:hypothetical protein F5Y15DRAFT_104331 [Xylariaceae sp. FL0016]|nr:hypothetical protein F5Y15DRAFT_104331 [Xylariaceae sp. FL0016]